MHPVWQEGYSLYTTVTIYAIPPWLAFEVEALMLYCKVLVLMYCIACIHKPII